MVPLNGRLRAKELLLFGLGSLSEWNEKRLGSLLESIISKSSGMRYRQIVFSFEDLAKDFMEWRNYLRELVVHLYPLAEERDISFVCRENDKWIAETRRRNMDLGVDVQIDYDF